MKIKDQMNPSTSIPLELISYRGLLKSAQDIVKGTLLDSGSLLVF